MISESGSRLIGCSGTPVRTPTGLEMISEDDFYALRARIERMNEIEFAAFRDDPANRLRLRHYDSFAVRQVLPYAAGFILLFLVSLAVAGALRF